MASARSRFTLESSDRDVVLIDPFCPAARELARRTPPLNRLGGSYVQACRDRIEWFAAPQTDDDGVPIQRQRSPPDGLVDPPDVQFDTAVLYLLMQSCAANFSPTSFEVRMLVSAAQEILRRRIKACYMERGDSILEMLKGDSIQRLKAGDVPRADLYKVMAMRKFASERSAASSYSDMHEIRFKTRWTDLLRTDAELVDFYIRHGWAFLSPNDLIDLVSQSAGAKMRSYVGEVRGKMEESGVEPHPFYRRIGKIVSELAARSHQDLAAMGGELREALYPPCIKLAQQGVDAGSRNYAITVLLTSFLSHARISPFAGDAKISDFVDDISLVTDDLLPRIFDAGARCNPPLFDDQPIEKANILYHLGFGLLQNPRLADSGNSTWYIPPNCEKIQREVPMLCKPDALCRRIKNPINYYVIKARDESSQRRGSSDEPARRT